LIFLHPRPAPSELRKYYPGDYACPGKGNDRLARWEDRLRFHLYARDTRHLRKLLPKGARVLDVGCGCGLLLTYLRAQGYRAYGIEMRSEMVYVARTSLGLEVEEGDFLSFPFPDGFFDALTFFHVLEHLTQPDKALLKAKRILKGGGLLLLQLPNIDCLQFKLFQDRWYGLEVPRHLYHFSPTTIRSLLDKTGFKVLRIDHHSLRNNPLILVSSLLPQLNYHRVQNRSGMGRFFYLLAGLMLVPIVTLEGMLSRGATITVLAQSI